MRSLLKAAALRLPALRSLVAGRDQLLAERDRLAIERDDLKRRLDESSLAQGFVPPGHLDSPIPSLQEVARDADRIFAPTPRTLPGIELRERAQVDLLRQFLQYYDTIPFDARPLPGLRYHYENDTYSYCDAIMLHCMLRHTNPRRVIEIGSGYSSCVTLDTNERCFDNAIETLFIEPYPDLLHSLLKPGDVQRIRGIASRLQDVPADLFATLQADDVLFVDSTHVAKIGSDVNMIFAEILPALRSGVRVHFHDVFYPFEYPRDWIDQGRAWNEDYMLRCFLEYNTRFRIELWNSFLFAFHADWFRQHMPLCPKNPGGSIWLTVV